MRKRQTRQSLTKRRECPTCGGCGGVEEVDGAKLRQYREERGKGLNSTAFHMGISATYLSDVERGRRGASPGFLNGFIVAVEKADSDLRKRVA